MRLLSERTDPHREGAARPEPLPTDAQIRQAMAGTLCRCMTYYRIQAAIKRAAEADVATASAGSESEVLA